MPAADPLLDCLIACLRSVLQKLDGNNHQGFPVVATDSDEEMTASVLGMVLRADVARMLIAHLHVRCVPPEMCSSC